MQLRMVIPVLQASSSAVLACLLVVLGGCARIQGPSGRIAFNSYRDGNSEIYAIDADGGGLKRLTNEGGDDTCPA
jgi:hypothetical protein